MSAGLRNYEYGIIVMLIIMAMGISVIMISVMFINIIMTMLMTMNLVED